ncbi:MAG: hypothetical protein QOH72_5468 [Solirubrobacteraceae bacterium]|jgi:hypothetical protein|nr:hypothetical protein [Solirubrobacteraceae bacterium]
MKRTIPLLAACVALAAPAGAMASGGGGTQFIPSAHENGGNTVTLPLHHGTSRGRDVWFVVLDANTSNAAQAWGANRSNKLANAAGTSAVQRVTVSRDGTIDFPASVDFSPQRVVEAPNGFPPARFAAGAVGEPGYSPLIQLPDGTILNAPQIADGTAASDVAHVADKVVSIDRAHGTVVYKETDGFARGNPVKYVSTDATDPLAAALEDATLAPALDAAPFAGGDGTDSARATLVAFVNGATGASNPQRQGLNSAVVDGLDPLNVLAWTPNQGRYSPLWDVHLAAFAPGVAPTRQTEVAKVLDLARNGTVTGPGGAPFGPAGFIVDCPIVSQG